MGLFRTESVALSYSNMAAAQQWWIDAFDCRVVSVPKSWDDRLPSDVALLLPGDDEPTILLSCISEIEQAHLDRTIPVVTVLFCDKLKKGHEYLSSRGIAAGPIKDGGDTEFFEIQDSEGHLIEICVEP